MEQLDTVAQITAFAEGKTVREIVGPTRRLDLDESWTVRTEYTDGTALEIRYDAGYPDLSEVTPGAPSAVYWYALDADDPR